MNLYKNHIVHEFVYNSYNNWMNYFEWIRIKTTMTNSTYMNSYKSVGWNSKKKTSEKMEVPPLSPGRTESVDKCTTKNKIQSQKWQYEIAHMYNYVRKKSRHCPQKRIIRFQWNGIVNPYPASVDVLFVVPVLQCPVQLSPGKTVGYIPRTAGYIPWAPE